MKKEKIVEEAETKLKEALDTFLEAQRKCHKENQEIQDELQSCHDHIMKAAQHLMNVRAII
jgi:predicted RNase H-like HicB family nuclease